MIGDEGRVRQVREIRLPASACLEGQASRGQRILEGGPEDVREIDSHEDDILHQMMRKWTLTMRTTNLVWHGATAALCPEDFWMC